MDQWLKGPASATPSGIVQMQATGQYALLTYQKI